MREVWDKEIPRERKPRRRTRAVRDEAHKAWVRSHPCCACGNSWNVEAAHTGTDGGMSMKASDDSLIPLCAWCHRLAPDSYHAIGKTAFEQARGLDCRAIAEGMYREFTESRLRRSRSPVLAETHQ